jgi:hypothetical protein
VRVKISNALAVIGLAAQFGGGTLGAIGVPFGTSWGVFGVGAGLLTVGALMRAREISQEHAAEDVDCWREAHERRTRAG